jgi:hypothetical protein
VNETVVLAFEVSYEQPAKDLSNLIETDIVNTLDVDISPGPNADGKYMVFVEFERDKELHKNILEIMKVVSNVTGINEWKYNFYKGNEAVDLTEDNLSSTVLNDKQQYVLTYNVTNESIQRIKKLAGILNE